MVGFYMSYTARIIAYEERLAVCTNRECLLSVGMDPIEQRAEALKKLYGAMFLVERDGGQLTPLSLGHLVCAECMRGIQLSHLRWASGCWELLPQIFGLAQSWDEV
jgi:hypothetical protein